MIRSCHAPARTILLLALRPFASLDLLIVLVIELNFVGVLRLTFTLAVELRRSGLLSRLGRLRAVAVSSSTLDDRSFAVVVIEGGELDVQMRREPVTRLEGSEKGVERRRAEGIRVDLRFWGGSAKCTTEGHTARAEEYGGVYVPDRKNKGLVRNEKGTETNLISEERLLTHERAGVAMLFDSERPIV